MKDYTEVWEQMFYDEALNAFENAKHSILENIKNDPDVEELFEMLLSLKNLKSTTSINKSKFNPDLITIGILEIIDSKDLINRIIIIDNLIKY